jgi:ABC-type uncharacterized transport system permease subunit
MFSNDATQYIAIAFAILAVIFIRQPWFETRAVGNSQKLLIHWYKIYKTRYFAVILSGFLAGSVEQVYLLLFNQNLPFCYSWSGVYCVSCYDFW